MNDFSVLGFCCSTRKERRARHANLSSGSGTLSRSKAGRLPFAAISAIGLSGCNPNVLQPIGPIGFADKSILVDSLAIMLAIVLPTIVAIFAFAWWFRASNARAHYRPDWAYSGQIEMVVWGIPLLVILLLGGVAWIGSHELDPAKPLPSSSKPLDVQVVSLDWKWLFIYPVQKIASVNELVLPVGIPVHFALTSASVMSVFFVPRLGSMIYTMNGMRTQLNLEADQTGVFYGESSHFNGDGFADMHFKTRVLSAADFSNWVRAASKTRAILDDRSYEDLAKQSVVPPAVLQLADSDLFHSIVTQRLPPGPGPTVGRPTPAVSPRSGT
ncbi:MAG: ubiquinol oxidase subunit II [Methylovirgula sp.]